ncbi:MAG: PDZ domain-containing protein [Gemmataceae bacterium]
MHTRLFLSAIAAGLLASAPCPAQAPADKAPVVVPFKLLPSRHMLLDVTVNGKGPYHLIFDTGAPLNLIGSRVAKESGLLKNRKSGGLGLGFGIFGGGFNQVEVGSLAVGDAKAEKLPAIVMDHPTVKAISDAFRDEYGPIEGIVGFPFFGRFATTIDYQKKQLTLVPTDFTPGDYLNDLTQTLASAAERKAAPRVVGAAGLWGFAVEKPDTDDEPGVKIGKVFADTPAASAGLKAGDRLLTLDGRWTDTVADAYLAASLVRVGRATKLTVRRDGKERTVTVTPTKGY